MRRKRVMAGVLVAVLALLALRHPSADIRVITHRANDPAPMRVQAAVDLGLMAVSLLVTWTHRLD